RPDSKDAPPLFAIFPYVEARPDELPTLYLGPVDPTVTLAVTPPKSGGNSTYAVNKIGFAGLPDPVAGFADGASNTIAVAEPYARCGPAARFNFLLALRYSDVEPYDLMRLNEQRRATFADSYYGDVVPVSTGPGQVQPSRAGATFQLMPKPDDCDSL